MKSYISYYRFFDANLIFKTNLREIHEEFHRVYAYFKSHSAFSGDSIVCSLVKGSYQNNVDYLPEAILGHGPVAGRAPRERREPHSSENGSSYSLDIKSHRYSMSYAISGEIPADTYLAMFAPVIYEVKEYFLIHAGSLAAQNNRSLIISAPCGFGKTTLTLELLKEGFRFLSDELAPVSRHTGLIYPYPRGVGMLREGKKKIIVRKCGLKNPCKPSCVVFLCLPRLEGYEIGTRYLELALGRLDKNVYRRIGELPEVREITVILDRLFPVLRLSVNENARVVPGIQKICRQNNVPIMYTLEGRTTAPDFSAKPELKEISRKDGIFELSRNVLNTGGSALLEEVFGGSHTKMIFELTGLMSKAKFYRLTIGRLPEMTALVKNLCSENAL